MLSYENAFFFHREQNAMEITFYLRVWSSLSVRDFLGISEYKKVMYLLTVVHYVNHRI